MVTQLIQGLYIKQTPGILTVSMAPLVHTMGLYVQLLIANGTILITVSMVSLLLNRGINTNPGTYLSVEST